VRTRQFPRDLEEQIGRGHHRGGERDVLGVIEHRPVPDAAGGKRCRRHKRRAGAADRPRRRPRGGDAADADHRSQQVANGVGV
jgi:hypothetical protein